MSVTASNPLGSKTVFLQDGFYVQFPPDELEVKASEACVQFGKKTYFNARVRSGTNVSYSWKLDDETELVNAGERTLDKHILVDEHTYISHIVIRNNK